MGSLDQSVRLRVASIVGKEEEQKLNQAPFLLLPMNGSSFSPQNPQMQGNTTPEVVQMHQQAVQSMSSSPSTLSQHVHAYSHVGKTKSGSNSSSSVGSQNGSTQSMSNSVSTAPSNPQGAMLANGANFPNPMQQFALAPGSMNPMAIASVSGSQPLNPQAMPMVGGVPSPLHHVQMASFGAMLPILSSNQAQGTNGLSSQPGAMPPGRTSNSASSSSFSYPSGGNSGGSNSSDTRTQLSSAESEEEGNGEGMVCRRTARREYHKKIERKRRDRMRMLYDKLRSLTEASELADKNGVLEGAIALIQDLKQQNQELLARAAMLESTQCSSSSTGDSASTGDSREGSVASSEAERENKRSKTTR